MVSGKGGWWAVGGSLGFRLGVGALGALVVVGLAGVGVAWGGAWGGGGGGFGGGRVAAGGVVARGLGGDDRRFFVRSVAGRLAVDNRGAGLRASFSRAGVVVRGGSVAWSLGLQGYG